MYSLYFFTEHRSARLSETFFFLSLSSFSFPCTSWEIHTNIMIASPHTSFLWAWNRHNSWAVRRCHSCKRKQGSNWLQELSEDPPDTLPPPLLLCYELLNSRWGWLFDLLKIYQVSLPLCPWPSELRGGTVTAWRKGACGDEGAGSWQTTLLALPVNSVGRLSAERM